MIPRRVRIIRPAAIEGQLLPVEEVLRYPGLVLLGEPGVGKTTAFQALHEREGGLAVTAKHFAIYGAPGASGQPLFVDALDEKRPRSAPGDTTERLIQSLLDTRSSKLRISCRTINWLGISDERDFEPMFAQLGEFVLARLEPLDRAETAALLREYEVSQPDEFIRQAVARGIERLLENPQTLKMLAKAVRGGANWPSSRRDLFSQAAVDLLTEANPTQQTQTDGQYAPAELRPIAGSLSASMLIADVERLAMAGATVDEHTPRLRSLPLDATALEACVSRPLFEADATRGVRPPHRSVQEFLAAEWLASKVRAGHSLRRILALISVDGSPASELRGLYGWLPTMIPDAARELLAADPYGVVTQGAPEALTPANRRVLFQELARLSVAHPGFRRGDWPNPKLAMLSSADVVEDFRAVLADPEPPYDLLMTVLDALQFGEPQPALSRDLLNVLAQHDQPYSAQQSALMALLQVGGTGRQSAIDFLRGPARGRADTIRLRVQAAELLFPSDLTADDLAAIVRDYVNRAPDNHVGLLWDLRDLADRVEPADLDHFATADLGEQQRRGISNNEPRPVLLDWISGVLVRHQNIPAAQLWTWLETAAQFRDDYMRDGAHDDLKAQLKSNSEVGRELFRAALAVSDDEYVTRFWRDFELATLGAFSIDLFMEEALALIAEGQLAEERTRAVYNTALRSSYSTRFFDPLYEIAEGSTLLEPVRQSACYWLIEDWRIENRERNDEHQQQQQRRRATNQANFDEHRDAIAAGRHGGWLGWLAEHHYLRTPSLRYDEPRPGRIDRIALIAAEYGPERAELARQGLVALTAVAEWPTVDYVLDRHANQRIYPWWLAGIAGMDERWTEQESFDGVSVAGLQALGAIALCYRLYLSDGYEKRWSKTWLAQAFEEHSAEMQEVLVRCINAEIRIDSQSSAMGLEPLTEVPRLREIRAEIALDLLQQPVPGIYNLRRLTSLAAQNAALWPRIALLVDRYSSDSSLSEQVRDHWLALGLWVAFDQFESRLRDRCRSRIEAVWAIRDAAPFRGEENRSAWNAVGVRELEFSIREFGIAYEPAESPGESSGSHNPWDASRLVDNLLSVLASRTGREAAAAFSRLTNEALLVAHRDTILHYAGNQIELTRQQEYVRPTWTDTLAGLFSSSPANVADLHALVIDELFEARRRVRSSNTDTYKAFWNEGPRGVIENPKVEDSCRDRLLDLLRPRLSLNEISAEPEGHMVTDNRCDVLVTHGRAGKVVVEVKRDQHRDVWSACANQLDRLYTRDPDARGYGIYLVFWHGRELSPGVTTPPTGIPAPTSASEMEAALTNLIPQRERHRIRAIVIDVTRPES